MTIYFKKWNAGLVASIANVAFQSTQLQSSELPWPRNHTQRHEKVVTSHILWVPIPTFFWLSCNLVEILVLAWNTPPTQLSTHFASFFTLDHQPARIKQVKKVLLFAKLQTKVWNTSLYTKNIIFSTKQAWNISDNQFYLDLNDLWSQWNLMLLFYFIISTIFEISWKLRIFIYKQKVRIFVLLLDQIYT